MTRLEPGVPAPDFTLPDQDGNPVALADLRGRRVVVYFYPKDETPGCTKEARQFNEQLPAFDDTGGTVVIGISPDDGESHRRFRAAHGLAFSLLSDPEHRVMEAYGAWGEKSLYGKRSTGVIRTTVLVEADGTVARVWSNVRADGHAGKVLATLR